MYNPGHFRQENEHWRELVMAHPLATVLTSDGHISHLPLLLEGNKLLGHKAAANPQTMEGPCTVIFHGPEAYVSPLWYEECDVPTWNYLVVHIHGTARTLPDPLPALQKLSAEHEGPEGWAFEVPKDLTHTLHRAITAFEIEIDRVEAKFKLSQNRSAADRQGVIRGLRAKGAHAVARWMEKLAES